MTTISTQKRKDLRSATAKFRHVKQSTDYTINRLLDALEDCESRAEAAESNAETWMLHAKEMEVQRGVLAEVLISKSYCPDMYNQCANPESRGCVSSTVEQKKECWLEWAAEQA